MDCIILGNVYCGCILLYHAIRSSFFASCFVLVLNHSTNDPRSPLPRRTSSVAFIKRATLAYSFRISYTTSVIVYMLLTATWILVVAPVKAIGAMYAMFLKPTRAFFFFQIPILLIWSRPFFSSHLWTTWPHTLKYSWFRQIAVVLSLDCRVGNENYQQFGT